MRQQEPLISVIIPVYNVEKYLPHCIDSIVHQSYRNIEVILIDNASFDGSPIICDRYSQMDARIRVIHLIENVMASGARNTGVQNASGEWIMFVDSDDFWDEKDGLRDLVSFSKTINYEYDFIIFNYKSYFQNDNLFIKRPSFSQDLISCKSKIEKLILLLENSYIPAPSWGKLIKLKYIKEKQIDFKTGTNAEDILWFLNLMETCENFALTNISFYVYRRQVPGAGTSGFNIKRYNDLFNIVSNESQRINSNFQHNNLKEILHSYLAYEFVILLATAANFKGKEFIRRVNELMSLKWLLRFDINKKVRKTRFLIHFLPASLVAILLHNYARLFVNRT